MVREVQTNTKSKTSLILAILSILLPFFGLILGIIGVVLSRKAIKEIAITTESGKRLASFGLFCSVVGIILQTLAIIAYISFTSLINVS